MIPQDVKDKIEAEFPSSYEFNHVLQCDPMFKIKQRAAEYGYSLRDEEVQAKDGEIERLKKDLEEMTGYKNMYQKISDSHSGY